MGLFKVKSKRSGTVRIVYAVQGIILPQFLFYRDGKWEWDSSCYYEPLEE